jgi:hypothetical protein
LVESPRWHEGRLWFSDWTGGCWVLGSARAMIQPATVNGEPL